MYALRVIAGSPPRVTLATDHPRPVPGPGEVLIRVLRAGICATDIEITHGYMQFTGTLGHEFVGVVEEGPEDLRGRRVVGEINCPCRRCAVCARGMGNHCPHRTVLGIAGRDGAFASYLTLPAANCHVVPSPVPDEAAVFAEPLAAAVHVRDACTIERGMSVAVLGSGRLGLLVAQVLALEPCELEVIGRNPRTLDLCRPWGLKATSIADLRPAMTRDVVVECTGLPDGLRLAMALCRPCGTIVLKSTYAGEQPLDLAPAVIHEFRVVGNRCGSLPAAIGLLADGRVDVAPMITGTYPLSLGLEAIDAAGRPDHIKVLLVPEHA